MKISDRLLLSTPCFSFEFFPPKTNEGVENLFKTFEELAHLEPGFVSVTYGAGGSTRQLTVDLVARLKREIGIEAMAHLTCVGHTQDELKAVLERLAAAGMENVLLLRGDPPKGQANFQPVPGGFRHASELVHFVKRQGFPFCLGSACYPEKHIESPSAQEDLDHLKEKVDAGLDFLVTQMFFDNAFYFDFVARARAAGIGVPIVPGIMPITNPEQLERMVRMCGVTIPMQLSLQLERVKDNPEAVVQLGVAHATVQCLDLLRRGVPGIHFYTLNRSPATRMIVGALKARGQNHE